SPPHVSGTRPLVGRGPRLIAHAVRVYCAAARAAHLAAERLGLCRYRAQSTPSLHLKALSLLTSLTSPSYVALPPTTDHPTLVFSPPSTCASAASVCGSQKVIAMA